MSPVTYRKATEQDIPQIRSLADRIWRACYIQMIGEAQVTYMLDWMYSAAEIRRQLIAGVDWQLVEANGNPVGYLALTWEPGHRELELNKLYLDPVFHGQGMGQQLLGFVKERARALGASRVHLRVNKANATALAAYLRAGFTIAESLCQDIGNGFVMDDYLMVWIDA